MKNNKLCSFVISIGLILLLAACAAMQSSYTPPPRHPDQEGEDLRFCTDCHDTEDAEIPFEKFNHGLYFGEDHGAVAGRFRPVCAACHRESYCSDCHGVGIELKPSIKDQTGNYRRMPHRGDYLSRHVIDGRINPAPCYRCHGNPKSAQTCKSCHG